MAKAFATAALIISALFPFQNPLGTWTGEDLWSDADRPVTLTLDSDGTGTFRRTDVSDVVIEDSQVMFRARPIYIFGQIPWIDCVGEVEGDRMTLDCEFERFDRELSPLVLTRNSDEPAGL